MKNFYVVTSFLLVVGVFYLYYEFLNWLHAVLA